MDPDLELIAQDVREEYSRHIPAWGDEELWQQNRDLAVALTVGWVLTRYDDFIAEFEVLSLEKEVETTLAPNIILQSRVDMVVRRIADEMVYAWNWKTTSSTRDWTIQWRDDIQAMTETLATQENLGTYVQGCIFEGLYKGGTYNHRSTSPLVYGYQLDAEPTRWSAGRPAKYAGWTKRLVSRSYPGGTLAWLGWLAREDPETLGEQFVRSEPILKNDEMVRDWLKQVIREETDIEMMLDEEVSEDDRLCFFKQNKGRACRWCQFAPVCRWETTLDALTESGIFVPRVDHHAVAGEE